MMDNFARKLSIANCQLLLANCAIYLHHQPTIKHITNTHRIPHRCIRTAGRYAAQRFKHTHI
jgi:hypothetical protein